MTSVFYMSDLHLEFGRMDKKLPEGDVLILAGDITLANSFLPTVAEGDTHAADIRQATMALFAEAKRNFNRVFYLFGNHEPYGSNISHLRSVLEPYTKGATFLEDESVDLNENTILFGGSLWTDFNKKNASDMDRVARGLNDYRLVTIQDGINKRVLTPLDTYKMHLKTRRSLGRLAKNHPDKNIVVATHHAPSVLGISDKHHSSDVNAGYYSDLEDFIKKHPNITHWVHGHTHIQKTYQVHQCQVFANCRGYIGREYCAKTFETNKFFEI